MSKPLRKFCVCKLFPFFSPRKLNFPFRNRKQQGKQARKSLKFDVQVCRKEEQEDDPLYGHIAYREKSENLIGKFSFSVAWRVKYFHLCWWLSSISEKPEEKRKESEKTRENCARKYQHRENFPHKTKSEREMLKSSWWTGEERKMLSGEYFLLLRKKERKKSLSEKKRQHTQVNIKL